MNRGSDDCGPKVFPQDHYYNMARHNGKSSDAINNMSDDDLLSTVTSSKSDCGGASRHSNPNEAKKSNLDSPNNPPLTENCYTSLRYRKMALRRKRSLSVADLPIARQMNPTNQMINQSVEENTNVKLINQSYKTQDRKFNQQEKVSKRLGM